MRIKRLDLLVTTADLESFLAQRVQGERLDGLRLTGAPGAVHVHVDYRLGRVRLPVDLTLTVAGVRPERLDLAVHMKVVLGLPQIGVQKVLEQVVERIGIGAVRADGPRLAIDIDDLGPYLQLWFRVRRLAFTPEGVEAGLDDLTMVPLVPRPEAETEAPAASAAAAAEQPPPQYRDFYARLRGRIQQWSSDKVPERYRFLLPWLLLLPDLFVLLCKLVADPRVGAAGKLKLGAAIAYVVSPIDLIPDLIPVAGVTDDLGIVLLALNDLVANTPPAVIRENWPGEGDIIGVIHQGSRLVQSVLGGSLLARLRGLLRKPEVGG